MQNTFDFYNNFPEFRLETRSLDLPPLPHPLPYQGSKRKVATAILQFAKLEGMQTFYEPFAGSAAVTMAAAQLDIAQGFVINDSLVPLARLWQKIIRSPEELCARYEEIWNRHTESEPDYYYEIRAAFNRDQEPAKLLYLLTRCVKNSLRFNSAGEFNQSVDKRRLGTRPANMRRHILGAHWLLRNRTRALGSDYREVLADAMPSDFVYLDPPRYGGVAGQNRPDVLFDELEKLNSRDVPYILSVANRSFGTDNSTPVPAGLDLYLVELDVAPSGQSIQPGSEPADRESLYLSPAAVVNMTRILRDS